MTQTYTVKQVAEILGYSTNSIYTFLKEKRIKGVRVGRGRFRIPAAELSRLLQISKRKGTPTELTTTQTALEPVNVQPPADLIEDFGKTPTELPHLFDWFIGLSAIILGYSMFLFSRHMAEFSIANFIPWLFVIKIGFIAFGFVLLGSDVNRRIPRTWHEGSLVGIALMHLGFAMILWLAEDISGSAIFGLLGFVIISRKLLHHTDLVSLVSYGVLLGVVTPFILLAPAETVWLPQKISVLWRTWWEICTVVWFVGGWLMIRAMMRWWQSRQVGAYIGMGIFAALMVTVSIWYAQQLYWGRALLILMFGLMALYVPWWEQQQSWHRKDRRVALSLLGLTLVLFIAGISAIKLVQDSLLVYAKNQLLDKVTYGKLEVQRVLADGESALTNLAQNPALRAAMVTDDADAATGLMRSFFEANHNMRRLLLVTTEGQLFANYPLTSVASSSDYASRDYFINAVSTKRPFVSDLMESPGTDQKKIIVIAIPVLTADQTVIGVIIGSLDMEYFNYMLQQVASESMGEYFVLADHNFRRIIHPDPTLIDVPIEDFNLMRRGIAGQRGVAEGYGLEKRMLQAYDSVGKPPWGIMVAAPMTKVLRSGETATVMILTLMIANGLLLGIFTSAHALRWPTTSQTGDLDKL